MEDNDENRSSCTPVSAPRDKIIIQCVDLTSSSTSYLDTSLQPGATDELCETCRKIKFNDLFSSSYERHCGKCCEMLFDISSGPHCNENKISLHYHLGKVEDIQLRKNCAFCRLIVAVHNSADLRMLDVSLEQPLMCTITQTYNDGGIKIYFDAGNLECDDEHSYGVHTIRQCLEDSSDWTPLAKPSSAPTKWFNDWGGGLHGRLINSHQVDFDLLRKWLYLCETLHGDICCRPNLISRTAEKTIRLIDVLHRQIVDSTTNERYLALSYVWGRGQQLSLNRGNCGDLRMLDSLKDNDMTATVKDAFDVVAKLGERYLWVDRLCILQDDEQDKLEQMSFMDQVYNAAIMTIVAANTCVECGSKACIPGVKPHTRQSLQHSEVIRGVRLVTAQPNLASAIFQLNWSSRGWTYQEAFCSLRCLVFTPYQAYFHCKSEVWCEDSCYIGSGRSGKIPFTVNALCRIRDYRDDFILCNFAQYIDAVEGFSRRQFTVETDILWAFTAITKTFQLKFQDNFIWGLPVESLDVALLWLPTWPSAGLRAGCHNAIIDRHRIKLPFPTWSWVSQRCGVRHVATCEYLVKGLVEWHKAAYYAVNRASPFSNPWRRLENHDILNSTQKNSTDAIMDERALGFLRFTAASAHFDLDEKDLNSNGNNVENCREWAEYHIRTCTRKIVGTICVPISWLEARSDNRAEFILLSMRTHGDDAEHENRCKRESDYNIMLIDWKQGPHCEVAVRIGITQIHRDDWVAAGASSKLIVLN